jgi:anti-sigma regulatory factor (Ser/Thr protein kinase)
MSDPSPPSLSSSELASLHALLGASRQLAAEPDPIQALWRLVCALRNDLGIDRAGIFAYDPHAQAVQRLVGMDSQGEAEFEGPVHALADGAGPLIEVARRERPYYLTENVADDFPSLEFAPGVRSLAIIPIIAADELLGTLSVDNCITGRPLPRERLELLFLYAAQAALPLFARYQKLERERAEAVRRRTLREVIHAVTNGKLRLCNQAEIDAEWPEMQPAFAVERPEDVGKVREKVREEGREAGIPTEREWDLTLCASEAATNALVHGHGGYVAVAHQEGRLRVRVSDRGEGIPLDDLPGATLQAGWSKARRPSMGQGFTLIHKLADCVYLSTGPDGTTLIIEMEVEPKGEELPDTWDSLLDLDDDFDV